MTRRYQRRSWARIVPAEPPTPMDDGYPLAFVSGVWRTDPDGPLLLRAVCCWCGREHVHGGLGMKTTPCGETYVVQLPQSLTDGAPPSPTVPQDSGDGERPAGEPSSGKGVPSVPRCPATPRDTLTDGKGAAS